MKGAFDLTARRVQVLFHHAVVAISQPTGDAGLTVFVMISGNIWHLMCIFPVLTVASIEAATAAVAEQIGR